MMIHGNVRSEQKTRKIKLKNNFRASPEKRNRSFRKKKKRFANGLDGSVGGTTANLISCNLFESGRNYSEQLGTTPELDNKNAIVGLKGLYRGTSQSGISVVVVEGKLETDFVSYHGGGNFRLEFEKSLQKVGVTAFSTKKLNRLLNLVDETKSSFKAYRVDHPGFHTLRHKDKKIEIFVFANGDVIGRIPEDLIIYPAFNCREEAGYGGSWEAYEDAVSDLIKGQPNLLLLLGAALAPVIQGLASFHGYDGENICAEITGPTSVGKTTLTKCLSVAVWGSKDLMQSLNATSNAVEEWAPDFQNMVLALDESTAISGNKKTRAEMLKKILHALTQKNSRGRMGGEIKRVPPLFVLMSSNTPFLQIANEDSSVLGGLNSRLITIRAGNKNWMFDGGSMPCESGVFIDTINYTANQHYGHLSRMFVCQVIKGINRNEVALKERINKYAGDFMERAITSNASGEFRRKATKFALIYAVLKLAQYWKILPREKWGNFGKPIIAAMRACLSVNEPALTVEKETKAALRAFQRLAQNGSNSVFDLEMDGFKEMSDDEFYDTIFKGKRSDGMWFLAFSAEQFLAGKLPGFKSKLQILKDAGRVRVELKNGKKVGFKNRTRLRIKPDHAEATPESCYMILFKRDPIGESPEPNRNKPARV